MLDALNQGKLDAERTAYLKSIFSRAVAGDLDAQTELSGIALGQPGLPRELCNRMDGILSGTLVNTTISEVTR